MPFLVAFLSFLAFLGLHALVHRRSSRGFGVDAMLARGISGAILASLGFGALATWREGWREAFLDPRSPDSLPSYLIWFLVGSLVADLLWFGWGWVMEDAPVRIDLVLHHLLGLGAAVASLLLGAGQVALVVACSTELLPVTTGLRGLAKARRDERLERRSLQAGLAVVLGWRMPLWLFLATVLVWRLAAGLPFGLVQGIALAGLSAVFVFDVVWARSFRRSLARQRGSGGRQVPREPEEP